MAMGTLAAANEEANEQLEEAERICGEANRRLQALKAQDEVQMKVLECQQKHKNRRKEMEEMLNERRRKLCEVREGSGRERGGEERRGRLLT
eukprot:756863-Hanusia_phi.AAC.2